jgi:type II secretory pathway pseudopilin PulG
MQRKNCILMPSKSTVRNIFCRKMFNGSKNNLECTPIFTVEGKNFMATHRGKNGMAMIMAIIVIIVLLTIMATSISLTTKTAKRTTDIYLYEQAMIYSKSAAELVLLDIAKDGPCTHATWNKIFNNLYEANITIKYIYTSPSPCTTSNTYFEISTPEQNGSVLMDITVTSNAGSEPIRYFRRTIQKL